MGVDIAIIFMLFLWEMEDPKGMHKFLGRAGEDFQLFPAKTEAELDSKEVLNVMLTDVIWTGDIALNEEQKLAVAKARAIIIQILRDQPLRLCLSEKGNPYMMWEKLRERYTVSNISTRVQLQTRISRFIYDGQVMSDNVDDFE